jgi:hypothetical protein
MPCNGYKILDIYGAQCMLRSHAKRPQDAVPDAVHGVTSQLKLLLP